MVLILLKSPELKTTAHNIFTEMLYRHEGLLASKVKFKPRPHTYRQIHTCGISCHGWIEICLSCRDTEMPCWSVFCKVKTTSSFHCCSLCVSAVAWMQCIKLAKLPRLAGQKYKTHGHTECSTHAYKRTYRRTGVNIHAVQYLISHFHANFFWLTQSSGPTLITADNVYVGVHASLAECVFTEGPQWEARIYTSITCWVFTFGVSLVCVSVYVGPGVCTVCVHLL